jgi:hypothetical protein
LPDEEDEEMRMMIPEQNNVSDVHELNWKELTRAVKSEDDPARILQLLHRLNESLLGRPENWPKIFSKTPPDKAQAVISR